MLAPLKYRLFFNWLLLFSLLVHVFIAHHDGIAELILCVHSDGRVAVETDLHHDQQERHHNTCHDEQETNCHHSEGCKDIHLSLLHPENYVGQQITDGQDALKRQFAERMVVTYTVIPTHLAVFKPNKITLQPLFHPPPQRTRILTTTVLLI